jgi:hypothetical protein
MENIGRGRKGFATNGDEHQGRLHYEDGIATAGVAFTEASADPQTMMLAEEAFIEQEFQFCSEQDIHTRSSLKAALQGFNDAGRVSAQLILPIGKRSVATYDAFLSLEAVEDTAGYKVADKTWPHNPKSRIQGFPKDAFHQACIAHRTRLNNVLRAPGINMIEKAVLRQRAANMTAAQNSYIDKQRVALAGA